MTEKHKFKIDITSELKKGEQTLSFRDNLRYPIEVMDFKEKATREALLSLGWIPPEKADMHTELVEALEDVLLQFDSCTIRQDNLKTKIRNLINKATKESDNAK